MERPDNLKNNTADSFGADERIRYKRHGKRRVMDGSSFLPALAVIMTVFVLAMSWLMWGAMTNNTLKKMPAPEFTAGNSVTPETESGAMIYVDGSSPERYELSGEND